MARTIIQPGFKTGSLTVIRLVEIRTYADGSKGKYFECLCLCGNTTISAGKDLSRKRSTKSCRSCAYSTHGLSKTPEYRAWAGMRQRTNPEFYQAKNYSERGITLCEEWQNSPVSFIRHIGPMPTPNLTVERINNNKGYEPGNVRWATRAEQQHNRRGNVMLTLGAITMCRSEWAVHLGISDSGLVRRLRYWSVERALTEPVEAKFRSSR